MRGPTAGKHALGSPGSLGSRRRVHPRGARRGPFTASCVKVLATRRGVCGGALVGHAWLRGISLRRLLWLWDMKKARP